MKFIIRDQNDRSFNEVNFMKDQEIQPTISRINELIKETLPRTSKIMFDKVKIIEECKWTEKEVEKIFIFENSIFQNKTQEANIIWNEIMDNILTHMDGITKNPLEWTISHKFWLNSKFICLLLGINIFENNDKDKNIGKLSH